MRDAADMHQLHGDQPAARMRRLSHLAPGEELGAVVEAGDVDVAAPHCVGRGALGDEQRR